MGIVVDMFQSDRHHSRYETTGDKVARPRDSFTEKWVICMTYYIRPQIMYFSYFSEMEVLVSNHTPLRVDLSYRFCQLDAPRYAYLCVLLVHYGVLWFDMPQWLNRAQFRSP
jgi:hypothetical protein